MKWTEEQFQAINQEGSNIIVSAGAGSGKTAVLSERVLRKVKEGVDIRKILILTFTNEAAGEMKNRIRKKLKEANLKNALEYIDAAYITTFDAYALGLVKKYHYLLNISKEISIIDSSIIDLEKMRILDEIFLDLYDKKDERFLKLIGDFSTRDDNLLKDAILNINKALDLKYDKKDYLQKYILNFFNKENIDSLFNEYFLYLKDLAEDLENHLYLLEGFADEKLYTKLYQAYSPLFSPKCYDDLYKHKDILSVQFRNIPEEALAIKETIKELVKKILELTKYSEAELKENLNNTKSYVSIIIDIILALDDELYKYKFKQEAFEFIDIAKMAIKLVKENDSVRDELKDNFNEILIDEYQDTNDLQEEFIKEIENNNVYMVGDIKQSIYRFRNANPNNFKYKYENYCKHIGGEKIDLLKNFRSRREVLANINEIFNLLMSDDFGGVAYKNNHEMVYGNKAYIEEGATNYSYDTDILSYDYQDKEFKNPEIEAFIIVKDIIEKIKSNYQVYDFDLKKKRDATYQDFCIILDRGTDMATYKKIFEYFAVPMEVYKDSDLAVADDLAIVKNIINLIVKIKNQEKDAKMRYSFVSIARSYVARLTDQEIFSYIADNTFYESSIYQTCFTLAKNLELKTVGMLLQEIIDAFNFYEKLILVGNVEAGMKRLAYLETLANMAEDLGFTIEDFLVYLDNMINNNKEIRYKEASDSLNCVKIMNIHKSKGLEFPICYFAGFKKNFNMRDLKERFLYDSKYGILTPYFKEGIGTTFLKTLIQNRAYQEEISEKIRLFYVALTRAKEKMIIVLPCFKSLESCNGIIDNKRASKYRSFYDFVESISGNIKSYIKGINLEEVGLTKDYELLSKKVSIKDEFNQEKIDFRELNIEIKEEKQEHASKVIKDLLTKDEAKTLEYGTSLHEQLELIDFKDFNMHNKYVDKLRNNFDFINATIYQELEFFFNKDDIEYHGIIDLMLEYEDEIKIIDYKLKNIDDEAYIKQLSVYYDYISLVSSKPIHLYLYSILDDKIKEITYIS